MLYKSSRGDKRMNIGDIVKYVGAEIAEKSGKLLSAWIPFHMYDRGDTGVICEEWVLKYNTPSGKKTVQRYSVRMIFRDENLVHNKYLIHSVDNFYEFELEKV